MDRLQEAIERKDWDLAAHYLVLGMLKALEKLPPEAIEAMLELLAAEDAAHPHRRRDRSVKRRRAR